MRTQWVLQKVNCIYYFYDATIHITLVDSDQLLMDSSWLGYSWITSSYTLSTGFETAGSSSVYCSPRQKNIVFLQLSFSRSQSSSMVLGIDLSMGSFSISWTLVKRVFLSQSVMGGIIGNLTPSLRGICSEGHQKVHSSPQKTLEQLVNMPRSKGLGWVPYLSLKTNVAFIISILVIFLVKATRLETVRPSMEIVRMKEAAVRNIQALISPSLRVFTPVDIITQYLQMESAKNWQANTFISHNVHHHIRQTAKKL